jgi:hypothetical protein
MHPNLRSNRNQAPKKLINPDPIPAKPKKPKKQLKRKPTRSKAPAKALTNAEEVVNTAEQLVALQRLGRSLNKVTKPAERLHSRTTTPNRAPPSTQPRTLQQRFTEISSSPPVQSDLPEVSTICAGALPIQPSSPLLPQTSSRRPIATSPRIEEDYKIE